MSDELISKQVVLDALLAKMDEIDDKPEVVLGLVIAAGMIKDMPSVTPAEKVGRWVFVKGYEGILYECTVCQNKNTHTTVKWNYCPHCGAKMQEVDE